MCSTFTPVPFTRLRMGVLGSGKIDTSAPFGRLDSPCNRSTEGDVRGIAQSGKEPVLDDVFQAWQPAIGLAVLVRDVRCFIIKRTAILHPAARTRFAAGAETRATAATEAEQAQSL